MKAMIEKIKKRYPHNNRINRSSHTKQVSLGPYTVNSDPTHKNQVTFDLNTKTKSNSIPHTKIKLISMPLLKSSQFDPHSKIKSISMPSHKTQFNFDPISKTKYFRTQRKNQVNFDDTKTKRFAARIQKPSQFRPPPPQKTKSIDHYTQNKFISAHTRSISIPRTKNKSPSIPTLKPSQIRSLTQNSS